MFDDRDSSSQQGTPVLIMERDNYTCTRQCRQVLLLTAAANKQVHAFLVSVFLLPWSKTFMKIFGCFQHQNTE